MGTRHIRQSTREARFFGRVRWPDGCWEWTGERTSGGYGRLSFHGRAMYAHRFSYELFVGPIPFGCEIDHLCDNPGCVRPDHLRAVSHVENVRRAGPGAVNAAKIACPLGHPYSPENTYLYRGRRNCRICQNARTREAKRRARARART